MAKKIYLDYAAATPVDDLVLKAMQPYFSSLFYNPSASYTDAQSIKKDLNKARADVALILGARPSEIIFTAGGTEANNLAIKGIMDQYPEAKLVISSIEHESVMQPARQYNCQLAPVRPDVIVDINKLEDIIDEKTVLVSIMYANNEVGTIQPIKDVARIIKNIRKQREAEGNQLPIYLHTDAAQAGNYLDLHVSSLGIDMMTLNGGKIYGPKASGALYVNSSISLKPQILGGGQESGKRSGTENVSVIIGFSKALELAQKQRKEQAEKTRELQQLCFKLITKLIPTAVINGSNKHRLPNNIHITIPGQDNERLLFALDEAGIMAAAGSACSASSEEPSHVLKAMGISDKDAQASLRFTLGKTTTKSDIKMAMQTLAQLIA